MTRRTFSHNERGHSARRELERGGKAAAGRVRRAKASVGSWSLKKDRSAVRSNRSQQSSEAPASSVPRADHYATDLAPTAEAGLVPPASGMSPDQLRALADRSEFPMSREALERWEELEAQPARDLPDLRALMAWRSPYIAYDDSESGAIES